MKSTATIGIDLGGTNVKSGAVVTNGELLWQNSTATDVSGDQNSLLAQLVEIAKSECGQIEKSNYTVTGVGVATPGIVDTKSGSVIGGAPNIPKWVGARIGDYLSQKLDLKVRVENDANAMALAEWRHGAAKGYSSAVCLTIGTGIGGGLIIDNKLWRGATQGAAEIGHIFLRIPSNENDSTEYETLEDMASATAMLKDFKRRLQDVVAKDLKSRFGVETLENLSARRMFEAFQQGDKTAQAALENASRILGSALAGVVNLLNPEIIVLGGGAVEAAPEIVEYVWKSVKSRALPASAEKLQIVPAKLGNKAGIIGAAELMIIY